VRINKQSVALREIVRWAKISSGSMIPYSTWNTIYIPIFRLFGYFMEYNTARSIPILFLVEYGIPWNPVFRDIGIPEEIGFQ
jgi:hypothetical protein